MNKKVKKLWVAALKSGEYKQGRRHLCYGNQNGTYHCCLGVLSELAVKVGVCSRKKAFEDNISLTRPVLEWSGMSAHNDRLFNLMHRNDTRKQNFHHIANAINKYL